MQEGFHRLFALVLNEITGRSHRFAFFLQGKNTVSAKIFSRPTGRIGRRFARITWKNSRLDESVGQDMRQEANRLSFLLFLVHLYNVTTLPPKEMTIKQIIITSMLLDRAISTNWRPK